MSSLKLVVLLCLVAVAAASGPFGNCRRQPDDLLLDDIPVVGVVVGGRRVERRYPGHKLTCVRCTQGLLTILGELLNITVLDGGLNCDRVLLRVNVGRVGCRCRVYGRRLRPRETPDCS